MFRSRKTTITLAVLFLAAMIGLCGCPGLKPFDPPNNREDAPEKGLFSGSRGEFILYQGGESTDADRQGKNKDQPAEETVPASAP